MRASSHSRLIMLTVRNVVNLSQQSLQTTWTDSAVALLLSFAASGPSVDKLLLCLE